MSLVALTNAVLDDPMPRRFHAEPMVRAVELLLQERMPRDAPLVEPSEDGRRPRPRPRTRTASPADEPSAHHAGHPRAADPPALERPVSRDADQRRRRAASTCRGLDVTRWREDAHPRCLGPVLLRPRPRAAARLVGRPPADRPAGRRVRGRLRRRQGELPPPRRRHRDALEVTVSPEQLAEVRRVTLTNHDDRTARARADQLRRGRPRPARAPTWPTRPSASCSWRPSGCPAREALLCRRRPAVGRPAADLGGPRRGRRDGPRPSARRRVRDRPRPLPRPRPDARRSRGAGPGRASSRGRPARCSTRSSACAGGSGSSRASPRSSRSPPPWPTSREEALALADQYHEASARGPRLRAGLGPQPGRAPPPRAGRPRRPTCSSGWRPTSSSPARPCAPPRPCSPRTARASRASGGTASRAIGRSSWSGSPSGPSWPWPGSCSSRTRSSGSRGSSSTSSCSTRSRRATSRNCTQHSRSWSAPATCRDLVDKPGGVFVRKGGAPVRGGHGSAPGRRPRRPASATAARSPASSTASSGRRRSPRPWPRPRRPPPWPTPEPAPPGRPARSTTASAGSPPDGREYRLTVRGPAAPTSGATASHGRAAAPGRSCRPPPGSTSSPTPRFGFLVSEAGSGFTWAGNSQTNRLTPWSNDPVADPPGEVVYLRDEETGEVWSPDAPARPVGGAHARPPRPGLHGLRTGTAHGLDHELTLFVPPDDPVKVIRLKVTQPGRPAASALGDLLRRVGAGDDPRASRRCTSSPSSTPRPAPCWPGTPSGPTSPARVAFADVNLRPRTLTADRAEFLGRNGSIAAPAALGRVELSGRVGAGLDPCAALQAKFDLEPGRGRRDRLPARRGRRPRGRARPGPPLPRAGPRPRRRSTRCRRGWDAVLGTVQVRTPDPAMDLLLNRWLLYQVLSCRLWGAVGVLPVGRRLRLPRPAPGRHGAGPRRARRSAGPDPPARRRASSSRATCSTGGTRPAGRGVRTRFSDDFLWLPFVACHYVDDDGRRRDPRRAWCRSSTGPLLRPGPGGRLRPARPSRASRRRSTTTASGRSSDGMRLGPHGLPLMGTGDWNDGMNRVGAEGQRRERLGRLVPDRRPSAHFADAGRGPGRRRPRRRRAASGRGAPRRRRGSTPGTATGIAAPTSTTARPLGSATNDECQIDSHRPVLGRDLRRRRPRAGRAGAWRRSSERLVRREDGLILLFDPAVRRRAARARLHQGLRARHPRERRPVHPRGHLGGAGRRRCTAAAADARRAVRPPQPDPPRRRPRGGRPLQGRALRRGGRRLRPAAARRPGRLDLVHRLGRLALPGRPWSRILGFHLEGDRLDLDPCIPGDWPGFEITYRHRLGDLPDRRREPARGRARVSVP